MATLRANVRRVNVDVIVTDPKGKFVNGLGPEDFSVEEDRFPQVIRTFDLRASPANEASAKEKIPALPSNTFLNLSVAPDSGTPTVILFDTLNTPLEQQSYARQELVKFINRRPTGTPIAIFVLGGGLHLLQGFTDDTSLLLAAMQSAKAKDRALAGHFIRDTHAHTPGGTLDEGNPTFFKSFRISPRWTQLMDLYQPAGVARAPTRRSPRSRVFSPACLVART